MKWNKESQSFAIKIRIIHFSDFEAITMFLVSVIAQNRCSLHIVQCSIVERTMNENKKHLKVKIYPGKRIVMYYHLVRANTVAISESIRTTFYSQCLMFYKHLIFLVSQYSFVSFGFQFFHCVSH